jgi:hypothetical protein
MHLKKSYRLNCDEKLTTGPLFKVESTLNQNISFWLYFVAEVSLVYFNLREIRNFLYPLRPISKEKFKYTVCISVVDPKLFITDPDPTFQ